MGTCDYRPTALRLGKYLGTSPELWIGLQGEFDLRVANRRVGPEIEKRIQSTWPDRSSEAGEVLPPGWRSVNLESDLIRKYVERLLQERGQLLPNLTLSLTKTSSRSADCSSRIGERDSRDGRDEVEIRPAQVAPVPASLASSRAKD